ncbi:bifunctional DNA primase/polymerase [Catenulispora pinisilvae]|uniref:bifunctional DNA primase/polymerase n=2 Tax=Catenulispora pinisilvae TaxID=2705253 RepID=UPI0018914B75|nr:bifunctional DNA primase/polymerase [Catenulispora pinisilvae]
MAEATIAQSTDVGPIRRARASLVALEALDQLHQAPHQAPASEDLAKLRGWSGWGPLAPALERSRTGSWKEIGERIAFLLPEDHYNHGIQAAYNAFYTPPQITAACWQILTDLGFSGGRILEPGCGAGAFIASTPDAIPAAWTGVERDPTTAAITRILHPDATIHAARLEETSVPSYGMDAVLGNVPFGDTKVYDPTAPRELTANLHNYFIYRSVKALRPGGVAVLVTSRYTMDAAGSTGQMARALIAREAELLGAIRLPNDALTSGGTEPLVDVLVLRRRRAGEPARPGQDQWITTGPSVGGQQVNGYFLTNPSMVLGDLAEDKAPRWGRTLRVDARPDDPPIELAIAAAGGEIVRRAAETGRRWCVDAGAAPITAETAPFELRADGKKEGSFHLVDGLVYEVVDGALAAVERPGKELPKLVALRDAALTLLNAEPDHSRPDEELAPLRAEAARRYDAYVRAHGYLNRYTVVEGKPDEDGSVTASRRRPSMGGFRRDPDFVTVLALEDFDDDSRTATKAALLTRRVNRPRERATHAESPAEAIALCRDELGRFDFDRVVALLGVDAQEAARRLTGLAFIDPDTNSWVPADEYLSGNVRAKLVRARAASVIGSDRFGGNIPALEAVIPVDLEPEQIEASLGAPWIPATDVRDFAQELLGFPVKVWHEPRTNTWSVTATRRAEESAAATADWGTTRLNAYRLLEYGLNGKAPVVYDVVDDKRVRNQDETIVANDRLDAVAGRFADWWREEPDRADRLTYAYNQVFNAVVPRKYDGGHLTFPGLDAEFEPYPHQRDMVARMISGDDALCPYPVGTGKTATMFMAAIKLKTLGLASKPLIIVVPCTLEQIARDGKRLFPNARILMAGKEDLATARGRKLFAARCAMEDWDAVVMSHPSFTSLPVHPTVKVEYLTALAADYRTALIEANADYADPRKIKQIAKMVDNLDAQAKTLLNHATDDGIFFEHLGTDYLLVDEMHYFKNLGVPVHTDGFAINGSKRAQDLDMKLTWQRSRHPGQPVVTGFTGTPVSNTLLELFILQHYLQPQRLEELGLTSADAWAKLFVRFATGVEITPDGGFRLNRRPVEIINIPELMHTVAEFAELRAPEAFPVVRPDAERHVVVIDASDAVRDYVHDLADRADDIRAGGVPANEDNMLKICSDGRKVALHESLVGLEPEGPGKVGAVAANVARIYHGTKDLELVGDGSGTLGRLQMVFCDLGTPNKDKGNQVYGIIRQQLIAAGVPVRGIRFIHEAATDAQRLVLFDQCNKGEVNVLLGSTDKLGVGVNVQRRAVALHHVDAPWRPDQVEQREGRVWRPKNLNSNVDIYRYVTKDSFDAFMWQTLERKEKALRPILAGQVTARSIEDIGDVALDYGQIKAVATGNPMLAELNELNVKVKSLASLAASHQRNQRRLRADIHTLNMQAAAAATNCQALESVAQFATAFGGELPWRDVLGNSIPHEAVPALLGDLVESTIAKGYCDHEVLWRGMTIDFTCTRRGREELISARIITGDNRHRVDVPVNRAWTAKGQHWRIRDAIAASVDSAEQVAAETRANIEVLRQRIAENEAAIGQPFADQAALDEARGQRAVLDAAIREQARRDEEARRSRVARTAEKAAVAGVDGERNALLLRMLTSMSAVVSRGEAEPEPTRPQTAQVTHESVREPTARSTPDLVESRPAAGELSPAQPEGAASTTQPEPEPKQATEARATSPEPDSRASLPALRRITQESTTQEPSEMFERAIALANQGFHVFPLKPGTKRPMFKAWGSLASTDPAQIARWWRATPSANIAIACGPSNLLVIDLDKAKKPGGPQHGQQTLTALAAGHELPRTLSVASARGGRHLYFRQPEGTELRNTAGSETAGLGPLIDTRGHGGFIVAPGSVFEGGSYRVEDDAPVAPLPGWIVDELGRRKAPAEPALAPARPRTPTTDRRRSAYGNAALNRSVDTVATAPEGTRNDTLNREAFRMGRLVGGGVLQRNDVESELVTAARHAGLSPGEVANTVRSGLTAGASHPRSIPDRDPLPRTRRQHKDNVMTTTEHEPEPAAEAVAALSTATEAVAPQTPERSVENSEATAVDAGAGEAALVMATASSAPLPETSPETAAEREPAPEPAPTAETHASGNIWNDLRASFDNVHQVLANWADRDDVTDDLKPALDEASRRIAEIVDTRGQADSPLPVADSRGTEAVDQGAYDQAAGFVEPVDTAYSEARNAGLPAESPEWVGISAIRDAVHNLWDTVKAVAGRYWAELSADVRVAGPLKSLATRAARGIANLATRAVNHLEQRGAEQRPGVESLASLREAYINARGEVRAHAAAYEWQRISALWGTVGTLARQTGDVGIRAVVARSADAISDHADALSRRVAQDVHAGAAARALTVLARAAEHHASVLRAPNTGQAPDTGHSRALGSAGSAGATAPAGPGQQGADSRALQARANEVARLAQARLGQAPRPDAVPSKPQGANLPRRHQENPMSYRPPASSQESARGPRW